MRSVMKKLLGAVGVVLGVVGCGGTGQAFDAELRAPELRQSRVTLTPALDVSSLAVDASWADRLVIDEITVNVADLRLLGADPRVPSGGLKLTESDQIVSTLADASAFPFPAALLEDDLAVYVRLAPHTLLGSASVIIRARLFSHAVGTGIQKLSSGDPSGPTAPDPEGDPSTKMPDPEGDPSRPADDRVIDPEGDPSKSGGMNDKDLCAQDPEGDPSHCKSSRFLKKRLALGDSNNPYVPVELRGIDAVDLVVDLAKSSRLNVVVGIPAARWLDAPTVKALESALASPPVDQNDAKGKAERNTVIVQAHQESGQISGSGGSSDRMNKEEGDDYRLLEGEGLDPSSLRRH